ncbi:MAG: fluoride efflux transporter CrcB [Bacteroidia bacterium]
MQLLKSILWVAGGGALGASFRYLFYVLLYRFNVSFYLPTAFVNFTGCFVMGWLITIYANNPQYQHLKLLLLTGLLGGFTTFSAFGADFLNLIQQKQIIQAFAYALATNVLAIAATFAGYKIGIS